VTTLAHLLAQARASGVDRLDAQLLLSHVTGLTREALIAHDQDLAQAAHAAAFRAAVTQRAQGVPLAYLTGRREFHGLMLRVTPSVLVPRPETELLVDWALELLATALQAIEHPEVVDLGTGSGAIALAVKHVCTRSNVLGIDESEAALTVARANAGALDLDVAFEPGNWLARNGTRGFDLILANPPYIDADDPHLVALHAEPSSALTPGLDGLTALRDIVLQAPGHLHPGGWLLLEHGHNQAAAVRVLLEQAAFGEITTRCDLAGVTRCTGGRLD
jgi:release factor glutamine methyltransferase